VLFWLPTCLGNLVNSLHSILLSGPAPPPQPPPENSGTGWRTACPRPPRTQVTPCTATNCYRRGRRVGEGGWIQQQHVAVNEMLPCRGILHSAGSELLGVVAVSAGCQFHTDRCSCDAVRSCALLSSVTCRLSSSFYSATLCTSYTARVCPSVCHKSEFCKTDACTDPDAWFLAGRLPSTCPTLL